MIGKRLALDARLTYCPGYTLMERRCGRGRRRTPRE